MSDAVHSGGRRLAVAAVMFGIAAIVAAAVTRVVTIGPIGPDAAAPVIAFERLIAGQRLEGPLFQTSKPLLTLAYGIAYGLAHDWRAVSALAILSFAGFVTLASVLAGRIGGLVAGSFVFVGVTLLPVLLQDVTLAYGVSWGMLSCAIAATAVLARRPRYAVAGIALACGALARPEVLAVTGFALLAIVVASLASRARGRQGPPRAAWLVALGLLAIPVMMVHDAALVGDPMFWANIAQVNSAGHGGSRSFVSVVLLMAKHALSLAPLLPFALLAIASLLARRRLVELVIVAIVPVAVASFFILSGSRGTVISVRYLMPIDIGLIFAAGVGLGALDVPAVRAWLTSEHRHAALARLQPLLAILGGAVLALCLAPSWPRDAKTRAAVRAQVVEQVAVSRAFAKLAEASPGLPTWRDGKPADARPLVLLPARLFTQGVVDLDLPLWAVDKLRLSLVAPDQGLPEPGTIIYHVRRGEKRAKLWSSIEVTEPTVRGPLQIVPLVVDEDAGMWILRTEAADAP